MRYSVELNPTDHAALVAMASHFDQSVTELLHEAIEALKLDMEIRGRTPDNAELVNLTDGFRPPQRWFDEDDDPFKPASGPS